MYNRSLEKQKGEKMCRILKGNQSIMEYGNLYWFIRLVGQDDIEAAKNIQGKHKYLNFNVIAVNETESYAGPFHTESDAKMVIEVLNARANQITKYKSRKKEVPDILNFLYYFYKNKKK